MNIFIEFRDSDKERIVVLKLKSINRKERQGFTQRSQRVEIHGFNSAAFAITL